jgi:hypothetical protein
MSAGYPGSTVGGTPSAVPLCEPEDLAVTVRWRADAARGLRGQVVAENTGGRVCRLPGKPAVTPFGVDGTPLPARTVITLEMRPPGYVILQPGQRAAAPVAWLSWCGQRVSPAGRSRWPPAREPGARSSSRRSGMLTLSCRSVLMESGR